MAGPEVAPAAPGATRWPAPVTAVELPLPRVRSGKVRECFTSGDRLLLVATDRISAFDVVFDQGIPGKGRVLTGVSAFWFRAIDAGAAGMPRLPHHFLTADPSRIARETGLGPDAVPLLDGRSTLARRAEPVPFECVVRGFLDGSALAEYRRAGAVSGIALPPGLRRGDRLRHPIFTPARKALTGHDENVTFDAMAVSVGGPLAETLRDRSLTLYAAAARELAGRGLLLADTKFEFGLVLGGDPEAGASEPLLIDELLTPDSSRLWETARWQPGRAQASFDKQPLRDHLEALVERGLWDRRPPAPALPEEVVRETSARYAEAFRRITGRPLEAEA